MTPLDSWDISADHAVPSLDGIDLAGFRAGLGIASDEAYAFDKSQWFEPQLATTLAAKPDVTTLDYWFLSGPRRGHSASQQMAAYAPLHKAELACLDWENDAYTDATGTHSFGTQPFGFVLAAINRARMLGLNPGVYASESLLTPTVVAALVRAKIPFLWAAMYPGPLPAYIANCGLPLIHQYTGTGVDRSHVYLTLDQLHALAGRPSKGNAVKFIQLSTADVAALPAVTIPAGTVIEDFEGTAWTTLGPTNVHRLPGLVDAHSNRIAVVVNTARFYADGQERPTAQVAVVGH